MNNALQDSFNALNYTANQGKPESLELTTHQVRLQKPEPVIRSKRDVWDDCFPASTRDPFNTVLYVGDFLIGILGFAAPVPPITAMIRIFTSLYEPNKCNGQSLWVIQSYQRILFLRHAVFLFHELRSE